MTNADVLSKAQNGVALLAQGGSFAIDGQPEMEYDGAQTTALRWAAKKNRDKLQEAVEAMRGYLADAAEDTEISPEQLLRLANSMANGEAVEAGGLPEDLREEIESLLEEDAGIEPYTISEEALMQEPQVPLPVLDLIDWMIE